MGYQLSTTTTVIGQTTQLCCNFVRVVSLLCMYFWICIFLIVWVFFFAVSSYFNPLLILRLRFFICSLFILKTFLHITLWNCCISKYPKKKDNHYKNKKREMHLHSANSESLYEVRVTVIMFNVTFNNMSVISWWSVLSVEETGVPGVNHRPVESH
jgi:hypothetical protein